MRTRLVERARDGDDVAFSELVDLDGDLCYAIAYRILRDVERAQDAVQQAFLLAWRELPRLRDPERFSPWLHRLLVNACYEEHRRHRRWTSRIRALPVDGPISADPTVSVDDRDALDRAFLRLTPQHRAVFVLHHHAGLPLAEIADIVGVPVGTVKSRLHHATRSLRAALVADSQVEFHGGTTGMNQPRDLDPIIATWLDDGPIDLPDETRRAIAVGLRTQPRARRMAILGGSSMSPLNRLVAAAAIVLAVGGLSVFVLSNRGGGAGGTPTPSVVGGAVGHAFAVPVAVGSRRHPRRHSPSTAGWRHVHLDPLRLQDRVPTDVGGDAGDARLGAGHGPARTSGDRDATARSIIRGTRRRWPARRDDRVNGFAADVPDGTSEDAWLRRYYAGPRLLPDDSPDFVPDHRRRPPRPARHVLRRAGVRPRRRPRLRLLDLANRRAQPLLQRRSCSTVKLAAAHRPSPVTGGRAPEPADHVSRERLRASLRELGGFARARPRPRAGASSTGSGVVEVHRRLRDVERMERVDHDRQLLGRLLADRRLDRARVRARAGSPPGGA